MRPKSTGSKTPSTASPRHGVSGGKKRPEKRVLRRSLGRKKIERVAAVLDTHGALREPLPNAQQEKFCQALLTATNATQAAIYAGYSGKTARVQASHLLTIVNIQRRLAGLFENTAHHSILRRRDVLRNLSVRASSAMADVTHLIGLPWDEFAEKIRTDPVGRSIKRVKRGVEWDPAGKKEPVIYVREVEVFDPGSSERLLADLLGWEAPKRIELTDGYKGRLILPVRMPVQVGTLPPGFWEKDGRPKLTDGNNSDAH